MKSRHGRQADGNASIKDRTMADLFSTEPAQRSGRRQNPQALLEDLLETPEVPAVHWSVTWADLMMTMFILFTVLFVYASAKRDFLQAFRGHVRHEPLQQASSTVGSQRGPVAVYDMPTPGALPDVGPQQLFEMTSAAITNQGGEDVTVELDGDAVRISLHGPMLFGRTRADVSPAARPLLRTVARIVAKARYEVHVHGHTDNFPVATPDYPTNWELSAARAVNVARVLIEDAGLNPALVSATGHSMYKPRTPNVTAENKAENRRVEILLTRPKTPEPTEAGQ